jgi:hypothetical protein
MASQATPDQVGAAQTPHQQMTQSMWRNFIRDLAISGGLPWLMVYVLRQFHVGLVAALAISTIVPLGRVIVSVARTRRLDAISLLNLGFLLASIVVTLLTKDVHFALLKGVAVTAAFSLLCFGSLLAPRPLMFYLGRQFSTLNDPVQIAQWNKRWHYAKPFRTSLRLITIAWGLGYLLEVIARVIAAYTLPPMTAIAIAPILTYGMLALLMAGTISYSGAMRRKYAAQIAQYESAADAGAPPVMPPTR